MIPSFRNRILAAVFVFTSLAAFDAEAGLAVDLGQAGPDHWAVFTLGNGVSPNVDMEGQSLVTGNVGAAGKGDVTLGSSQATINGHLSKKTGGKLTNLGTITGGVSNDDSILNQAAIDAQNASDNAWMLPVTDSSVTNVKLSSGQNLTITDSGHVVLKLNNFQISNGTFTLAGAPGSSYVINVSNQFSLSNSARIVLGPGISPTDVLFNVRGSGQVTISGGTQFQGILLATKRSVSITGAAHVTGEVIANSVNIGGQASVSTPVTPSTNN